MEYVVEGKSPLKSVVAETQVEAVAIVKEASAESNVVVEMSGDKIVVKNVVVG